MKPLAGLTILVTRAREQAGPLGEALAARGARVIEAPVIRFEDPDDWRPVDEAVARMEGYDLVLFTSANAVERFVARLEFLGRAIGDLSPRRIAAIGTATARALAARGLSGVRTPACARAEGILALLGGEAVAGSRVLIPRAEAAREVLPEELRALGALVEVVAVYRTVPVAVGADVLDLLRARRVDVVTFTSGSTVTNLVNGIAEIGGASALAGVMIAVIGPVTAQVARSHGLEPGIVSPGAAVADLVEAIAAHRASAQ